MERRLPVLVTASPFWSPIYSHLRLLSIESRPTKLVGQEPRFDMSKSTKAVPLLTLASVPLWPHQTDALDTVRSFVSSRKSKANSGSALIHMPTGTGKSGVIAWRISFPQGRRNRPSPLPADRAARSVTREVTSRFFTKLGLTAKLPKTVHNVVSAFPSVAAGELSTAVFVLTIQMLHSMKRRGSSEYVLLQRHVDLLIVDEGHYEPAFSWRDAIRGIPAPKVLFTATPFRNDLKLFDVDFGHAYSYTFHAAVADHTIRNVIVRPRPSCSSPKGFVDDVLTFYDATYPTAAKMHEPPRVIIRCDSEATIRQIGAALAKASRSYILIHENFDDKNASKRRERRTVPEPDHEPALFWVHQFKLLEGIDDPRFQVLAIFEELKTTRALVQQVGRVIRNPTRGSGAVAHFLDHSNGRHKELWDGFEAFDRLLQKEGVSVADFGTKVLAALKSAQPDVVYIDGSFRSQLNLPAINPTTELQLPVTTSVFVNDPTYSLSALCDLISAEYADNDLECRRVDVSPTTAVFVYLTFANSRLLRTQSFIECTLGATILHNAGTYLCAYDSSGLVYSILADVVVPVSVKELRKLFAKNKDSYLTGVSLRNANLGSRSIRSRAVTAARIEDTLPTFDDHSFVCSTAEGYSTAGGSRVRRYIGFGRGKVSDLSLRRVDLPDYLQWLDRMTTILASRAPALASFSRFAAHAAVPADPTPRNVLLDLTEVQESFTQNTGSGTGVHKTLEIEDACLSVVSGQFTVTANGKSYPGNIAFESRTDRYSIDIPDLGADFYPKDPRFKRGLVTYLNQTQSLRVIPSSSGRFYTLGSFYEPILRFGPHYDDDQFGLLKVLFPFSSLAAIGSEKGSACALDGSAWDKKSLFAIVDKLGVGHGLTHVFGSPDLVVCDDLETEAADFILYYQHERRVVFVHCKGKGKKGGAGQVLGKWFARCVWPGDEEFAVLCSLRQ